MEAIFHYILASFIHFLSPIHWMDNTCFLSFKGYMMSIEADGCFEAIPVYEANPDMSGLRLCLCTVGTGPPD